MKFPGTLADYIKIVEPYRKPIPPKNIKVVNSQNVLTYMKHDKFLVCEFKKKLIKEINTYILIHFGFLKYSKSYYKSYYDFKCRFDSNYKSLYKHYVNSNHPNKNTYLYPINEKSNIKVESLKKYQYYIQTNQKAKPIIMNTYLPTQIYNPDDVLCRVPIPNQFKDVKLGKTIVAESYKFSLVTATAQYYQDIMYDQGQKIQMVTPVVAEVVLAGDGTKLETGAFIAPKIAYWTPLPVSEDMGYWHFIVGKENIGSIYSKDQGEILFEKYRTMDLGGLLPESHASKLGGESGLNASLKTTEALNSEKANQ
jgi:hypothetical protein